MTRATVITLAIILVVLFLERSGYYTARFANLFLQRQAEYAENHQASQSGSEQSSSQSVADNKKSEEQRSTSIAVGFAAVLLGAMVADRILGALMGVRLGLLILALGTIVCAIAPATTMSWYVGTGAIALGSGFVRPAILTMYCRIVGDPGSYFGWITLCVYYLIINTGAAVGLLASELKAIDVGWIHLLLAGVCVALSLLLLHGNRRRLLYAGAPLYPLRLKRRKLTPLPDYLTVSIALVLLSPILGLLVKFPDLVAPFFGTATIVLFLQRRVMPAMLNESKSYDVSDRCRVMLMKMMVIVTALYWIAYSQIYEMLVQESTDFVSFSLWQIAWSVFATIFVFAAVLMVRRAFVPRASGFALFIAGVLVGGVSCSAFLFEAKGLHSLVIGTLLSISEVLVFCGSVVTIVQIAPRAHLAQHIGLLSFGSGLAWSLEPHVRRIAVELTDGLHFVWPMQLLMFSGLALALSHRYWSRLLRHATIARVG